MNFCRQGNCKGITTNKGCLMKHFIVFLSLIAFGFGLGFFSKQAYREKISKKRLSKKSRVMKMNKKRSQAMNKRQCPKEMVLVQSKKHNVNICVDKYEASFGNGNHKRKPLANQNYYSCRKTCSSLGKRLLTHKEWKLSCVGTQPNKCNKYRNHPVYRKLASKKPWFYKSINCKKNNNYWKECLKDPKLNRLAAGLAKNNEFRQCVSHFGVLNMVGNLGEWVDDVRMQGGRRFGRFNGGLYPQKRSSCNYTTTSHRLDYKDYSLGCRCAKDLAQQI